MAFPIDATDSLLRAGHENARRCATSLRVAVPKERRDGSDITSVCNRLARDEMTHRVQADALRLDTGCLGDRGEGFAHCIEVEDPAKLAGKDEALLAQAVERTVTDIAKAAKII
jgi:hypothetical protein